MVARCYCCERDAATPEEEKKKRRGWFSRDDVGERRRGPVKVVTVFLVPEE